MMDISHNDEYSLTVVQFLRELADARANAVQHILGNGA